MALQEPVSKSPFLEGGAVSSEKKDEAKDVSENHESNVGTVTFFDDSVTLAELKERSLPKNRVLVLLGEGAKKSADFFRKISRPKFLWIAGFVFVAILLSGGAWGAGWYAREVKSYPVLSVLPAAPDLVFEVNINADSKQYALLEKHASAFPGYGLLKKALDPVGEGKTLSEAFQDSLKRFNLDFDGDIKPVLGDSAYVTVSDMSPLGESLQKGAVAIGSSSSRTLAGMIPPKKEGLAFSDRETSSPRPRVLGDMTVRGVENDYAPEKPIDFLVASPVRDRKKARDTFEKLRSGSDFEVETLEYRGFSYFKVSLKSKETTLPDDISRFIQFRTLYHGLVGGNWICASSEAELKKIFDRQASRRAWDSFTPKTSTSTLADNDDFRSVRASLGNPDIAQSLVAGYFNVASDAFFKKSPCSGSMCSDPSEFIRYPERIMIGWSLGFTESGIDMRWTNKTDDEALPGKPEAERLSNLVPQKAGGKWLNIFSEHDGLKNRFYNFKRTRLTEKGREAWEETRRAIQTATTIDIERDVIDHLSESVAVSVLTAKDAEPEGVLVARVDDPQAMKATIEKMVDFVRNTISMQKERMFAGSAEMSRPLSDSFCDGSPERDKCIESIRQIRVQSDELKQKLDAMIVAAHLHETTTPEGVIYSFKLSNEFPYSFASFDFGFRDNILVFGTHFAAVQAFLREMGSNSTEKKLSHSDFYRKVQSASPGASYQDSFVVTQGVWDVAEYVLSTFSKAMNTWSSSSIAQEEEKREMDDTLFAFGSALRTMKLIGSDSVSRNGFETSSFRCVIESLPDEEKQRAERIWETISSEISSMDSH